jgi:hypothetical protein
MAAFTLALTLLLAFLSGLLFTDWTAFFGGHLFFGQTFRRKTGGDVLGAFDFLFVTFAVEKRFRRFLSRYFSTGFSGAAVRLLLLLLMEPAPGAKTHSTATAA